MVILRKASSMIELVIAIVVMGIAVMTLPLILERVQSNNAFTVQQEAILAAKTQIGDIITYPWDENSLQANIIAVLDTASGSYQRETNTTRRFGHVLQNKRRKFFTNETNASDIGGALTNTIVDIGDFDDTDASLTQAAIGEEAGVLDYRFDFNMTTRVRYIDDTLPSLNFVFPNNGNMINTSNIKMIEVTMQGEELSTFRFRAYSSNIGESQLLRRDY